MAIWESLAGIFSSESFTRVGTYVTLAQFYGNLQEDALFFDSERGKWGVVFSDIPYTCMAGASTHILTLGVVF